MLIWDNHYFLNISHKRLFKCDKNNLCTNYTTLSVWTAQSSTVDWTSGVTHRHSSPADPNWTELNSKLIQKSRKIYLKFQFDFFFSFYRNDNSNLSQGNHSLSFFLYVVYFSHTLAKYLAKYNVYYKYKSQSQHTTDEVEFKRRLKRVHTNIAMSITYTCTCRYVFLLFFSLSDYCLL